MPVTASAVTAGVGLLQAGIGYFGGRKAKRELENQATPTYTKSGSISDFYNKALSRYQQSPYQSNMYKLRSKNIARATTTGIAAMQDRGSAMAGIPALIQQENDAMLKAGAAAEQDQRQNFAQLGNAAVAQAGEDRKAWEVNQLMPYQQKRELLMQKAGGFTQLMNSGLQNIGNGAGLAMYGSMGGGGGSAGAAPDAGYYGNERTLRPSTSMRTVNPY